MPEHPCSCVSCCGSALIFRADYWNANGPLSPVPGGDYAEPTFSTTFREWIGSSGGNVGLNLRATRLLLPSQFLNPEEKPASAPAGYRRVISGSFFGTDGGFGIIQTPRAGTTSFNTSLLDPNPVDDAVWKTVLSVGGAERIAPAVPPGGFNVLGSVLKLDDGRNVVTASCRFLPGSPARVGTVILFITGLGYSIAGLAVPYPQTTDAASYQNIVPIGWPSITHFPAVINNSGFRNTPPSGFSGNLSNLFRVYRDGKLVREASKLDQQMSLDGQLKHVGVLAGQGPNSTNTKEFVSDGNIRVRYNLQASSEPRYDYGVLLVVATNGATTEVARSSGPLAFSAVGGEIELRPGEKLRLQYVKDATVDSGEDNVSYRLDVIGPRKTTFDWGWGQDLSEDGSYLVVAKHDESNPYYGSGEVHPRYSFTSFVLDRVPPVMAVEQWNDLFVGDPTKSNPGLVVDGSLIFRGPRYTFGNDTTIVAVSEPTLNGGFDVAPLAVSIAPGEYVRTFYSGYLDRSRNEMQHTPSLTTVVHPIPANGKLGANATILSEHGIVLPLNTPTPYQRLRLRFSENVRGVVSGHVVLVGKKASDPNAIAGTLTVDRAPKTHREYFVTLDAEQQEPSTQWTMTFQPDEDGPYAVSDDVGFRYFDQRSDFPEVGEDSIIYVNEGKDEDNEFHWTGSGYELLPVDETPQENEATSLGRCRLAARRQWIIPAPPLELIDTSHSDVVIGGTVSESVVVWDKPGMSRDSVIESVSTQSPGHLGEYSQAENSPIYIQMPATPDDNTGGVEPVTNFGLSTTIYPSTPMSLTQCVSPAEQQPHSSVVYGNSNITSLRIKCVPQPVEGTPLAYDKVDWTEIAARPYRAYKVLYNDKGETVGGFFYIGLLAEISDIPLFDAPINLTATLDGTPTAQNTWVDVSQSSKTYAIRKQIDADIVALSLPEIGEQFGEPESLGKTGIARGGSLEIDTVQAAAVALRIGHQYQGIGTTCAHDIQIELMIRADGWQDTYENLRGTINTFTRWMPGSESDYHSFPVREWPPTVQWVDLGRENTVENAWGIFRTTRFPDLTERLEAIGEDLDTIVVFYQRSWPAWNGAPPLVPPEEFPNPPDPPYEIYGRYAWLDRQEAWGMINEVSVPLFFNHPVSGGVGKEILSNIDESLRIEKRTRVHRYYRQTFVLSHAQEAVLASGGKVTLRTGRVFGVTDEPIPSQNTLEETNQSFNGNTNFHPAPSDDNWVPVGPGPGYGQDYRVRYAFPYRYEAVWEISAG